MNPATNYRRVAFETTKKNKAALIKYTSDSGRSMKIVMNNLLERFLSGEIDFKSESDMERKRIKATQ